MDAAWIAVVGSSVAAVGSAAAAVIASWATRRQSTAQEAGQERQWRRETRRRDSYAAFLEAGALARDELTFILQSTRKEDSDLEALAGRLTTARALTDNVRACGAKVFVEGPELILRPTRHVEEDLVTFRRFVEEILTTRRRGATEISLGPAHLQLDDAFETVAHLRRETRVHLDRFAEVARQVLDEPSTVVHQQHAESPAPSQELQWLLARLADLLGVPVADIDIEQPFIDMGFDSLMAMKLLNDARTRYALADRWTFTELLSATPEQAAAYFSEQR
ncbi:acyl carrier protein [Nocardia sp. NPDC050193]